MPEAPKAPKRPTVLTHHGDTRVDEWYWLRDRDDPEVLALLEAENAHTEAATAHTAGLRDRLFDEMVARIQETDLSVPARKGPWEYYTRTVEGQQYPISCRSRDGVEQVLLDVNELAEGQDFCEVANDDVSPDASLLSYGVDFDGGEKYTMRFRDLSTGADLDDRVEGTYYGVAWAADNRTVFYTRPDQAMRPYQLWRHVLGTPVADDVLVHQEDDERFFLGVGVSQDEQYVFLSLESKVTSEVRFLRADDPTGSFQVVQPREQGVEYSVEHHGESFLIVTNADGAENFKLVRAPVSSPGRESWEEVVPHRADVKLDGVEVFRRWVVLWERAGGLRRIRVLPWDDGPGRAEEIDQPEPVYTVGPGANLEFDTDTLRFSYQSMVTPPSVFDFDMAARTRELKKQQPVLGGYDPSHYETVRLWATAPDGEQVPMSVVYRRDTARDGSAPAVLYGYGSYEASMEPTFSSLRLSLLDRGFVYAIAHIRGGGELGRRWYEDGKLLQKRNTFTDFIACAEHLVAEGWTSPPRLAVRGGSAGGLLMGAVANMRPDLFGAVVAEVPFVDCLTTILDETLPLTVLEWEEWGNPLADPEVYAYMKSYSPFDNVSNSPYPAMLVTAGLNDPRVSYWEPAKWVQRLRDRGAGGGRPIILKVELGAGHMGPSGRYDAWRDEAFVHAFVLDALGVAAEPAEHAEPAEPAGPGRPAAEAR
ncbi:MAG TPA: S9 family peptidase [Acidimicrobiales bacterium]|jgi:oligopeptidase B|nr:S9 family peptidase [Acidimicrobiales bacterium]